MKQIGGRIKSFVNSRGGFMILAIALFWVKTFWAYNTKFNLGADTGFQKMLLALSPNPTTL